MSVGLKGFCIRGLNPGKVCVEELVYTLIKLVNGGLIALCSGQYRLERRTAMFVRRLTVWSTRLEKENGDFLFQFIKN